MAHTPGPWAIGQTVNNYVQIVAPEYRTLTDADHVVCELRAWRQPRCDDNANLIAAAVELLAAARAAVADMEGIMPEFDCDGDRQHPGWKTIEELRAAIAKAEGRVD
jgi:hypothetical protein